MTLRTWLLGRVPPPPPQLVEQVLGALGDAADGPAEPGPLLHAAGQVARRVQDRAQQTRGDALELLVADALTSYAFELGAELSESMDALCSKAIEELTLASPR